jgi:hypothetical protein
LQPLVVSRDATFCTYSWFSVVVPSPPQPRVSVETAHKKQSALSSYNAAIRRAGLEGRRNTNPVVDGQLVPRARPAAGHGPAALRKRRREESAAAAVPSTRARRPRRAVSFDEFQPDDEDGWD